MELCLAAKRKPGPRVEMRWWEQEGLDLEVEQTEGVEDTERKETGAYD